MVATISEQTLGTLATGEEVKQFILRNVSGAEAKFCNLGAAWVGFKLTHDSENLVLGCDTLEAFINQGASLGATIGRFANRIKGGQFSIDNQTVTVSQNMANDHIHGGFEGYSKKIWQSHIALVNEQPTLTFRYLSADGEEGFPGQLDVAVTVTLTDSNSVSFEYTAQPHACTVVNLTNHVYFNLQGAQSGNLNDHEFKINASHYVEADSTGMPTGSINTVAGTALDLTQWKNIATELNDQQDPTIARAHGYDHCYCLDNNGEQSSVAFARAEGIQLTCTTTLPGVQFYTGNFLGNTPINDSQVYKTHGAFCFEPGYWPDSPNHAHFPDCTFDNSHPYSAIIEYRFTQL